MIITIACDSEFVPKEDSPTIPICLTFENDGNNKKFYIHPKAPLEVLTHAEMVGDEIFNHEFALLDYLEDHYGCKVGYSKDIKLKNYTQLMLVIFWSFKDIEFLFKNKEDYINLVLSKLSRTRRISVQNKINSPNGSYCSDSIGLPYIVKMPDSKNGFKMRDYKLSLKIVDISAMQGNDNLKNYADNIGIEMINKGDYTSEQKARMDLRYIEDHIKFKGYAMGDTNLIEIKEKTTDFYNHIAELIGVEKQKSWGMSTGKIVARLLNDWFCSVLKIDSESLYKIHNLAGSEGVNNISKLIKERALIYGAMVDGGRTVKERELDILIGNLIDIDISGCYGNGLKNQLYAIGIPSINSQEMLLGDWLKMFEGELIPGLWYARISWEKSPFKQDLLISKTKESFTSWNWVINGEDSDGFDIDDDGKKVYDASMCLTTNSIHFASLNHDLLQTLKSVKSNQEWGWLLKNAVINCSLIYKKSDEVLKPTDEMLAGVTLSKDTDTLLTASKNWIRIDLKELVSILLNERKKYSKGLPMNVFLKLIINTEYGCIASEFFSVENACVSSVVVGNNITARARCLAWCMAKGFHSAMSITDGGVFDVNNVLFYKKKSLNLLEGLHRDILSEGKNRFCYKRPLMGEVLDFNNPDIYDYIINKFGDLSILNDKIEYNILNKTLNDERTDEQLVYDTKKRYALDIIDKRAWEHLASIFDIDIFKFNQFEFETKDIYTKLILHSKVDYYLEKPNGGGFTVAFRGMTKIWDNVKNKKVINPVALDLFMAIENDTPIKVEVDATELLSLSDYQIKKRGDTDYPLLPHDSVSCKKVFYSHSPRGCRVSSLTELNKLNKRYDVSKKTENALEVSKVKTWGEKLTN